MKSRIGYFMASTALVFCLFLVPGVAMAVTDSTLAKPVLLRYDKGGKSYSGPFTDEVSLEKGEKLYVTGSSFPGAKVTLMVGSKSLVADMVSSGSWGKEISADELAAGSDTIVGQSISGSKTSEPANLLKIKVAGAESDATASTNMLGNPYVLGGLGVLVVAILIFLAKKLNIIPGPKKKKSRKK